MGLIMDTITKYVLCKSRKLCEDVGIMFIKNGKISEFGTIVSMFMAIGLINWSVEYLKMNEEEMKKEIVQEVQNNKKKKNRYFNIELYSGETLVYEIKVKSLSKKLAVVKLAFMSRKNKTLEFNLLRTTRAVIDGEIVWEKTLPEDTEV